MKEWPSARGAKELRKHFAGDRLTLKQMLHAMCYDCCGRYADGKTDCGMPACPLYPLMAYQRNVSYKIKTISDSQKKEISQRMKRLSKGSQKKIGS